AGATAPSPRGLPAVAADVCSITSGLLTTPPRPVPLMLDRSTPPSAATRLAAGDALISGDGDGAGGDAGAAVGCGFVVAGAGEGARAMPALAALCRLLYLSTIAP